MRTEPNYLLLNDREIEIAIRRGLIDLEHPEVYLEERKADLIQPASMDLILEDTDETRSVVPFTKEDSRTFFGRHPDVSDDYVTFWPNYEMETIVENLRWYNGTELATLVEIRSTLRRIGLDAGFMPQGVGFNEDRKGFISIRNVQSYPVSIQKGTKIGQILWLNKKLVPSQEPSEYYIPNPNIIGSGICISINRDLEKLVQQGDLWLGENPVFRDGLVLFHAGNVETYNPQKHIIIHKDRKPNLAELETKISKTHHLEPGKFIDVRTTERIKASNRVGIFVKYHLDFFGEGKYSDGEELFFVHDASSGGWIDPGYGYGSEEGAIFSAQLKAYSRPLTINEGDVIGYGTVFFFPRGVGTAYGSERNSHY
ncbi:MAG: hypothetical protein ABIH49_02695 [archaeon]